MLTLATLTATRYVAPLREGGSLPGIVEADDDGLYVLKFKGAGQGPKALIAELLGGQIGRLLGLPIPEIALMRLDPALGRSEPDLEIHDLLQRSGGINLAMDYLPGALTYDPIVIARTPLATPLDAALASAIVWFDAYITNVDRTARNPNMLQWTRRLWLIDHGAALYFHHTWNDYLAQSATRFTRIKDHILLPRATVSAIAEADTRLTARLTAEALAELVQSIPDEWLDNGAPFASHDEQRAAYLRYLTQRLTEPRAFVAEAIAAREALGLREERI